MTECQIALARLFIHEYPELYLEKNKVKYNHGDFFFYFVGLLHE